LRRGGSGNSGIDLEERRFIDSSGGGEADVGAVFPAPVR
jgi:hypothetical protein